MIKYRVAKELDNGDTVYYTGRKNRFWSPERDGKYSYKGGWSKDDEAAKMYRFEKDAISFARVHDATVEILSFDPEVLDVIDCGDL